MAKRITIGAPTLDMIMKYGTTDRQTIEDRINEENNAKEKGVQPTPSSATQGTYLNPSYGNVTQTPYTAPLQKSQTIGTPTPKVQPAKVDPVKAKLEKIGKPTLDQAQVTQGKTLEENLREAAYAAETKQQFIGAPATMPKTQEEQIAERQKEL